MSCCYHRCLGCHCIFKNVAHGTDCPDCGGSAICKVTEEETCP